MPSIMMSINEEWIQQFIIDGLAEDIGSGDHTSLACIPPESISKAHLIVKDHGIIAGVELAARIFKHLDPAAIIQVHIPDGSDVLFGDIAFKIECHSRALLMGERLALNAMQRMSGIATLSNRFAFEVEGLPTRILDTRKTTPLLRQLEKWAVAIGGCDNYRFGLYDWIMIKDNHTDACGGLTKAIDRVHEYFAANKMSLPITVEVRNLIELNEVMQRGGVTRIMMDNFELPILEEAVHIVDKQYETEASGGIHLRNVRLYAATGVDFVSIGALTHSAGSLDMSLKVVKE